MYKDTATIKKLIRECYKQFYAYKFDNLQKWTILQNPKLPNLIQGDTDNPNSPITTS